MSRRWPDFNRPKPQPFGLTTWLPVAVLLALAALAFALIIYGFMTTRAHATCSSTAMMALAQEHSNDMAARDHLDHVGFAGRAARGARAENVGIHKDERGAMSGWHRSKPHAANMRLRGCRAVASAVSKSGRRYFTMEISQ